MYDCHWLDTADVVEVVAGGMDLRTVPAGTSLAIAKASWPACSPFKGRPRSLTSLNLTTGLIGTALGTVTEVIVAVMLVAVLTSSAVTEPGGPTGPAGPVGPGWPVGPALPWGPQAATRTDVRTRSHFRSMRTLFPEPNDTRKPSRTKLLSAQSCRAAPG